MTTAAITLAAATAMAVACGPPASTPPASTPPASTPPASTPPASTPPVAHAPQLAPWSPASRAMPGPAPRGEPIDAVALNAGCLRCHEDVAAEWDGSMHQRAYVDPVFQQALAIEPLPFCRGCHAPEADPRRAAPPALAELGVACVSCHLVDGAVLATPDAEGSADPHRGLGALPVRRDPAFATAAACASCHEFPFPDARPDGHVELMQSTVTEAAQSPFAAVACASCHMPTIEGRRSHAFSSTRDPEALRRALAVAVERRGDALVVTLEPSGVGHAFPTGDLFRRLVVRAELVGPDMNRIGGARRYLTRHFATRPTVEGLGRTEIRDDRPGGRDHGHAPLRVTLPLASRGQPVAPGATIHWEVVYERVTHPAPGDDASAEVADAVVLDEGRLLASPAIDAHRQPEAPMTPPIPKPN